MIQTCYIESGKTNYNIENNIRNTREMVKVDIYLAIWEYQRRNSINERNVS